MKKIFLLTILSTFLFSCEDDLVTPMISIDQSELSYLPNGGEAMVNVDTNIKDWYYSIDNDDTEWLKAEKTSNSLTLKIHPYFSGTDARTSVVRFYAGNEMRLVKVSQKSINDALSVDKSALNVEDEGGPVSLMVSHLIDFEVKLPEDADWLSIASQENAGANMKKITFNLKENRVREARSAVVKIVGKGEFSTIVREVTINQAAFVPTYTKVAIVSGETSSFQAGADSEIEKAFDGNTDTMWHSVWDNSATDYFPITAQFNFAQASNIARMKYLPRQTGGDNGKLKSIEIWAIPADTSVAPYIITTHLFTTSSDAVIIDFPSVVEGVSSIKINVLEGYGSGKGFAGAAEIEFYQID